MCRLLRTHEDFSLLSEHEVQADAKYDQHYGPLAGNGPRQHLCDSNRVTDLPLDVMREERRRIHRHGLDLQPHRFEIQGIHDAVLGMPLQNNLRQFVEPLIKRSNDQPGLDVKKPGHTLLLSCDLDGIDQPWRYRGDTSARVVLPLWECELCPLLHEPHLDTVHQLIADQNRVPLGTGRKKHSLHRYDAALRLHKRISMSGHSRNSINLRERSQPQ